MLLIFELDLHYGHICPCAKYLHAIITRLIVIVLSQTDYTNTHNWNFCMLSVRKKLPHILLSTAPHIGLLRQVYNNALFNV